MLDILKIMRVASASTKRSVNASDRQKALRILEWQMSILEQANKEPEPYSKPVRDLSAYLGCGKKGDALAREYATRMLEESRLEWFVFDDIDEWLLCINYVTRRAPEYNADPDKQFAFPMSSLFVFFMYTPSGAALFKLKRFNVLLTNVLDAWCTYLDTKASRTVLNPDKKIPVKKGWLSPAAQKQFCLHQAENYQYRNDPKKPYWGFTSYNDFFHRAYDLDTYRPLDGKDDDKVVVSANDGTVYRISPNVQLCDEFWTKGQPYSLATMLDHSKYLKNFAGGDVFQSFLSGSDYHRWHAPISGEVVEARRIAGLTFSEILAEGLDLSAGTESQGYEATVNTRGLIIIKNKKYGLVAVVPIGITEISSIHIHKHVKKKYTVKKGEELGYFSYGGSSLALVFQKGMVKEFIARVPSGPPDKSNCKTPKNCQASDGCLRVRAQIARF